MQNRDNVTLDDFDRIHELHDEGYGINKIGALLDINSSAVRAVLDGRRKTFSEKLSTRQIGSLLNGW